MAQVRCLLVFLIVFVWNLIVSVCLCSGYRLSSLRSRC